MLHLRSTLASIIPTLLLFAALAPPARGDGSAGSPGGGGDKTAWGLGAKVRRWYVPEPLQKLFIEDGPGAAHDDGAGLDFARRNGNVEIAFGFGADRLDGRDGYYLEKGADPTVPGKVDFVTFDNLQLWSVEVTVVNHYKIHKLLELRFGAGLGIGLVRGEMRKTDALCTSDRLAQDCAIDPAAMEVDQPADLPPVLPVVNVLVGLQFVPFDFLHLHVDAGLHSVPYVGGGATFYLW